MRYWYTKFALTAMQGHQIKQEGLGAFRFFFKNKNILLLTQAPIVVWFDGIIIVYYYYRFNYVLYFFSF